VRSDRRQEARPDSPARRRLPRPAVWLTLVVLSLALTLLGLAKYHRRRLDGHFDDIVRKQQSSSVDIAMIRSELATMNVARGALEREVDERLQLLSNLREQQFYIAIDTAQRKLRLQFGSTIVRECDVVIGPPREIESGGTTWKFVAFKGAMNATGKVEDYAWAVPAWVYAMDGVVVPAARPTIIAGLGKYIVTLPNGYVIHSPPVAASPLHGAKPASFLVSEADLRAIWPRVSSNTRVYVY